MIFFGRILTKFGNLLNCKNNNMESVFQHDKSMTFKSRSVRVTLEFLTFNIGLL